MKKVFVCLLLLTGVGLSVVGGQADYNHSYVVMSDRDAVLWLADGLLNRPVIFHKLRKIFSSAAPLLGNSNSQRGSLIVNYFLDKLPYLLQSSDFQANLNIIGDEINRVNLSDVQSMIYRNPALKDNPVFQNNIAMALATRIDVVRLIRRILTRKSARDMLPRSNNSVVSEVCYGDTMDFMDALVGVRIPETVKNPNPFNFHSLPWAFKMFDAIGKPSGGIMKGALYMVGSYDECSSIHAKIQAGLIVGNRTRQKTTSFGTKYCRIQFTLPDSAIKAFNVDTRGIALRITWGVCLPDTCYSDDVPGLFGLGILAKMNFSIHSVSCFEDKHISDDASAITASVILAIFAFLGIFTTLIEGITAWIRANFHETGKENNYELKEVHDNRAFVQDEKFQANQNGDPQIVMESKLCNGTSSSDLPPAYMPHKNDKGDSVYTEIKGEKRDCDYAEIHNGVETKYPNSSASNGKPTDCANLKSVDAAPALTSSPRKPKPPTIGQQLVKAFSFYTNMPKILSAKKTPSAIHCIHGIRFFSILWIILGHTYNYGIVSKTDIPTTENLVAADPMMKRFTFQGVQAAGFGVDTFFMISGMLITLLTLKDLAKRKPNLGYIAMFYFHRFWRLTPVYMIVIMAFSCLYMYMGEGPLWPEAIEAADNCKRNWWLNLLYINNVVRIDEQCLGWSWYLANDMQFYVISPVFILSMYLYAPVGVILTVFLMFAGIASAFYKEYLYGGDLFSTKTDKHYWDDVYVKPWCRVAAYSVGILCGYVMFKFKKGTLKMAHALIGWCLTFCVGFSLCYMTYSWRQEGGETWPRWGQAFYEAFGRPLWAACVAWIIFACHNGRGGIIDSILSFGGLIPLSRLTYTAYLVHPVIMTIYVYSKRSLLYVNDFDIAYLYMGHVCMTYMASFFVSLMFEAPFLTLEKIIFRRRGHKS